MSETPRKLGRYELIRRIAVGGMGEIYLARTRGTAGFEKTVIIKTILPHLAEEEEFVEKFLDEGRIVVNLTHGNIVPVFDMDEADGEYFIAMEYVPGRDLRDILERLRERGETMPPDLAAYVISEVCEGLGYAHSKTDDEGEPLDIVHRDVSPSNVLISTDGEVKIIDFGVARAADRRAKTVSGRIQGKCCYMSPEQARGQSLDYQSDIFSTGVVFYELLTCVRPFDGGGDLKSLELVRECDFEPPSHLEGDVPPELDLVMERALAEDQEERYDEITDMKVDLMEYLVSRGRAVTSEEIAEFLSDLFPEGLEREAFQEAREEADDPSGPMELDDALEYQLENLGDGEDVDPLEETLPDEADSPAIGDMNRTETITPESGLEQEEGDGQTPVSQQTTAPDRPEPKRVDAGRAGQPNQRPQTPDRTDTDDTERGGGSWLAWAGAAAALVLVVVAVGYAAVDGPSKGTLTVETTPEAAVVSVDGSRIPGDKTPRDVRLRPGTHSVKLNKEGYDPETFRIVIDEGEEESLSVELESESGDDTSAEARTFSLRTDPPGAELWANQEKLGAAPRNIEVRSGQPKFVVARREGCERTHVPVYYGRDGEVVRIDLKCSKAEADAGGTERSGTGSPRAGSEERPGSGAARPRRLELEFRSTPEEASVAVDGKEIGTTPVEANFDRNRQLRVTFEKSGYESVEKQVDVSTLEGATLRVELEERQMGCLNFFAVHPQYNELAIDGEWLDGRRQKLRNHELAPGTHEIRVRNPDAGKDETFTFEVDPGKECTSLTVWDPDEG